MPWQRTIIAEAGLRLDKCLQSLGIADSLRAARRMITDGAVLLNGKKMLPGHKVRQGDCLEQIEPTIYGQPPKARLIQVSEPYFCFFKPCGLHTANLQGRSNASLESQIPTILAQAGISREPILLQRLDFATSGIILAATSRQAIQNWRQAENSGQINKFYLAKLSGHLQGAITIKNKLECNGGKKVKILENESHPILWTTMTPLIYENGLTWAACHIKKGQRHQIRAHARAAGYPLAGDEIYGSEVTGDFLLRQVMVTLPGHVFKDIPANFLYFFSGFCFARKDVSSPNILSGCLGNPRICP